MKLREIIKTVLVAGVFISASSAFADSSKVSFSAVDSSKASFSAFEGVQTEAVSATDLNLVSGNGNGIRTLGFTSRPSTIVVVRK